MAAQYSLSREAKERLSDKLEECVADTAGLVKHLCKESEAHHLLSKAAKSFASQDGALSSTHDHLKRIEASLCEMTTQMNTASRNVENIPSTIQRIDNLQKL